MKAFWKSRPVKTVGILAALLVLGMLIAAATGHGETAQSGVLGTVFAPAHWAAEKISDGLATLSGNAKGNTEYEKKIDELERQLGEMQEQLADYKNIKSQNEEYKEALELKNENSGFQYVAADVVGRDSADPYLSFTISKGAVNGVKENDAVLYGRYLIGIVKKAYPTYSIVTTVLDPDFSVSAYDINSGEVSYVTGDAKLAADGCCKFENLSTSTDITYGSIIASAGISSKLPKGLIIGTVEEVADETTNISTYAIVKPGTDIANITDCLVLTGFTPAKGSTTRAAASRTKLSISLLVEGTTSTMPGLNLARTSSMVRQTQALPVATSLFSGPTPTPVVRQLPTMWILIILVVPETPTGTPAVTTASSPLCR